MLHLNLFHGKTFPFDEFQLCIWMLNLLNTIVLKLCKCAILDQLISGRKVSFSRKCILNLIVINPNFKRNNTIF